MTKKKIALVLVLALTLGFSLMGCSGNKLPIVHATYIGDGDGVYRTADLVMNAGEKLVVNQSHFNGLENWNMTGFNRLELSVDYETHEGVVSINNNVITAGNSGRAAVMATIHKNCRDENGKRVTFVLSQITFAFIRVVDEATMTPITTAQQLKDIELDLGGNYILKADINLAGIEWQPIGFMDGIVPPYLGRTSFFGIFVNSDNFTIKNLTINSSQNNNGRGGLFHSIDKGYVDGIVLENVSIDVSDSEGHSSAGGIVAVTLNALITNCKVEGNIAAKNFAGGIVGSESWGVVANCEFKGTIKALNPSQNFENVGAGGIVGTSALYTDRPYFGIFDCKVNATVISTHFAGGIVGFILGDARPINCIFTGSLQGAMGQGEIFGYSTM